MVILAVCGFLGYQNYSLSGKNLLLEKDKSSLSAEVSSTTERINMLQKQLDDITTERNIFEDRYNDEKKREEDLSLQFNSLKDTVGVLQKLYTTDPELLKKYSKVYFLNENYVPKDLVEIDEKYLYNSDRNLLFLGKVLPYLEGMMDDARADGVDLQVLSAYRSFGEQAGLKAAYTVTYGSGANQFSADQGYSEHQLGTTVDFTNAEMDSSFSSNVFDNSDTYAWLAQNAQKYGFILSYPKNNGYYVYEPWHWRFIGRSFATRLHEEGKSFYDLDQRLIDTYLVSFFD